MKTRKATGFVVIMMLFLLVTGMQAQAASAKKKALKAYKKFLSNNKIAVIPNGTPLAYDDEFVVRYHPTPSGQVKFALAYLDNNKIPELIVLENSHKYDSGSQGIGIFTWKNRKVKRVGYIKGSGGISYSYFNPRSVGYYLKRNVLMLSSDVSEAQSTSYYEVKGGNLEMALCKMVSYGEKDYRSYYDSLSGREFNRRLKSMTKGRKLTKLVFRSNSAADREKYLK